MKRTVMESDGIPLSVILIVLLILSAFFSAAETAYSSANPIRLRSRAEKNEKGAARALRLTERYDSLLSTILIGNNIVNIAMASIASVMFVRWLGGLYGPTASTAAVTLAVLIFGEITPKSLAKEMPEKAAVLFAPALELLMLLFTPLNALFGVWKKFLAARFSLKNEDAVTEEELVTMVSEAERDGELTGRESELIRSAIEFDDVEVQDVLTPRVDVEAVPDTATPEETAEVFRRTGYSRLPVYHGTIDNIVGVVHEKDLFRAVLSGRGTLEELTGPAVYTAGNTRVSELLRTLREGKMHLAVVVDEYGGTEGIITLEDILEELVGEIWDEHDAITEFIRPQKNGSILVSGQAGIEDVADALGLQLQSDAATVGGCVQETLARVPRVGDTFVWGHCKGIVTRTSRRRVQEIRLVNAPPAETEA